MSLPHNILHQVAFESGWDHQGRSLLTIRKALHPSLPQAAVSSKLEWGRAGEPPADTIAGVSLLFLKRENLPEMFPRNEKVHTGVEQHHWSLAASIEACMQDLELLEALSLRLPTLDPCSSLLDPIRDPNIRFSPAADQLAKHTRMCLFEQFWIVLKTEEQGDLWGTYTVLSRALSHRSVSYTHLRAHETPEHLVCRLLLEKKKSRKCR
eukprot:TRINITY_DN22038_c0_g1_i1.p1 TRINITY_DN22038_c0_g1~~TRINITY_DN22038_c0_g1_i1.p1  ORF type:complete len:209 (+),score=21.66 TRINITY_DN22038_c0_g1_i1:227-853(+)